MIYETVLRRPVPTGASAATKLVQSNRRPVQINPANKMAVRSVASKRAVRGAVPTGPTPFASRTFTPVSRRPAARQPTYHQGSIVWPHRTTSGRSFPNNNTYGLNMPTRRAFPAQSVKSGISSGAYSRPSNAVSQYGQQSVPAKSACNCAKCRAKAQMALARPNYQTAVPKRSCVTCGAQGRGCTLLQGFGANSALLSPVQQRQLRKLAGTLLRRNVPRGVVTGYTTNRVLSANNIGLRRAMAVVAELKRQMSVIRQGAGNLLRYRIGAKPGGRNVSICVR